MILPTIIIQQGMAPSSEGPGYGIVHNTLGGSAIPVRTVNFSPDVPTLPGRGGTMIPPSRGARTPQGRGQGPAPNWDNAQSLPTHRAPPPRNNNNNSFAPTGSQGPPWVGRGSSYEQEAGRPRGHGQFNSLGEKFGQFRATWDPSGPSHVDIIGL